MKIDIDELKQFLHAAAKNPPRHATVSTAKGAVEAARQEIEAMLKKGFSPKQITEVLSAAGVKISCASLETYLRPAPVKAQLKPPEMQEEFEALERDESGHGAQ